MLRGGRTGRRIWRNLKFMMGVERRVTVLIALLTFLIFSSAGGGRGREVRVGVWGGGVGFVGTHFRGRVKGCGG